MLSHEENELLSRVGAGTPMGDLMRQYWLPGALSRELPTPDSDPRRIMLLGVLLFLTIVALYAWMIKRFGVRRSKETDAERERALEDYRTTLQR